MTDHDLLFAGIQILELPSPDAAVPVRRAAAVGGRLAAQLGATVFDAGPVDPDAPGFYSLDKQAAPAGAVADPEAWVRSERNRILLSAVNRTDDGGPADGNRVVVTAAGWHNEATLFAASGLADLFGHPDRAPLVPAGHWGAVTAGYAVFGALASCQALAARGQTDVMTVDCVDALRWVNWKAPAMAYFGTAITRQGADALWPAIPCADGFVAFVHTDRDWPAIVEMIDDNRLREERFARGRDRAEHRREFLDVVREWAAGRTRSDIDDLFHRFAIPGAAVLQPTELLDDVMLRHRNAFQTRTVDGRETTVPVAPVRVAATSSGHPTADRPEAARGADRSTDAAAPAGASPPTDGRPLSGARVLDLGVLTAGAGTSSLLADFGAEVIKIESATKPDMFRSWAGESDSPLFHFSNRSKFGVDLDLKDPDGLAAFLELVTTADAVIENYRRGVLERLGIGFDELSRVNPRIVLASVSGQGLTGPRADHTTFGSTLEAGSGFSALTTDHDGVPAISGINLNLPDQTVCLFAAGVIASAITSSRSTGHGRHLDISQRDVAVYACGPAIEQQEAGRELHRPSLHAVAAGWAALGDDGRTEVPALNGVAVLAACRQDGSSAIVDGPNGTLVKGFPFTAAARPLQIGGPAPAIGQDNDRYLPSDPGHST
ncbi:MAG: CoA transferase [Actinomycetota bacterium]